MPKIYIKKHPEVTNLGRPTNFERDLRIIQQQANVYALDEDLRVPDISEYFTRSNLVPKRVKQQDDKRKDNASFDEVMNVLSMLDSEEDLLKDDGKNKKRKRSSINRNAMEGNLSKNALYKIYKEIIDKDVRHIYPSLIFNAFNTSNFDHLRTLIDRYADENVIARRSQLIRGTNHQIVLGDVSQLIWRSKAKFFDFFSGIFSIMPDATFLSRSIQLLDLDYVPTTFSGIPFHLFQNKSALNDFLVNMSKDESPDEDGESGEPGYIIVGNYTFHGTPTAPWIGCPGEVRINANHLCAVSFDCTYIFTMNRQSQMLRLESYVHLDDNKLSQPEYFHHPLSNITFDADR